MRHFHITLHADARAWRFWIVASDEDAARERARFYAGASWAIVAVMERE